MDRVPEVAVVGAGIVGQGRAVRDEWADRLGAELISPDGVVALGGPVPGRLRMLQEAGGIQVRTVDSAELHASMPLLADYRGPAMLDEDGGAIRTSVAVESLADALGDSVVTDEVISLHPTDRGTVEVLSAPSAAKSTPRSWCARARAPRGWRVAWGFRSPSSRQPTSASPSRSGERPRNGSPACRTAAAAPLNAPRAGAAHFDDRVPATGDDAGTPRVSLAV